MSLSICGFMVRVYELSAPELVLCSGRRSETISPNSLRPSVGTPFNTTLSGAFCGSGFEMSPNATLRLFSCSFRTSTALSESMFTASFTCTCRIKWVPPRKSRPRWMRLVMAVSKPSPEKLWGTPNIPKRNTSRTPRISTSCQRRFLFMTKTNPNIRVMPQLLGLHFILAGRDLRHRRLGHFQHEIVGRNAQVNTVVLERHDRTPQAAAGDDL